MPAWTIPYSKSGVLPMPAYTKIKYNQSVVLYNFRHKQLSKICIQLLRYKQSVPYLPVNASMDKTMLKK